MASFFSSNITSVSVALAEVEAALAVFNELPAREMCKAVFRDLLTGFKVIVGALERKEARSEAAYGIVVKWLRLYLKIQTTPINDELRKQFEKTIPSVVTYVIGSLQQKPKNMPNYHYQLLCMAQELLQNCNPATIEKMANIETGIIACLWLPIDFVGDFNTQMMALRLLVMLLKSVDNVRLEAELEKLRCSQRSEMKEKLSSAILVANYHAGKFENAARVMLNNYNMNLARDVLVYSFRCKTLHFGDKFQFYKTLSAEHFWIDLNYCPRTLSFNGCFKANCRARFVNLSVGVVVKSMQLTHNTLTVHFDPPAQFSKKLNNAKELLVIDCARLELPTEETTRLQENDFIFEYYNEDELQTHTNITLTQSDASSDNGQDDDECELQQSASARQLHNTVTETVPDASATPNLPKSLFQRSYGFLIGNSGETVNTSGKCNTQTVDLPVISLSQTGDSNQTANQILRDTFKPPSLPKYELAVHKTKAPAVRKKILRKKRRYIKTEIAQTLLDESPKTSRSADVAEETNISQGMHHPISELCVKRKSIRTRNNSCEEKKRNASKTRKSKPNKTISSSALEQLPKQVNKVKPMNHLSPAGERNPAEVIQPNLDNIINLTSFLENGNESAADFNDNERRSVLQNAQRITEEAMPANNMDTDAHATTAPQRRRSEVYEIMDESDAAPGQSYRNFKIRPAPKPVENKTKVRRRRKVQPKKKAVTEVNEGPSTSKIEANSRKPRLSRKRTRPANIDAEALNPIVKLQRLTRNANNTVYSADIEIDLTCTENGRPSQKSVVAPDNALRQRRNTVETTKNLKSFTKNYYYRGSTSSSEYDIENAPLNPKSCCLPLTGSNNMVAGVENNSNEVAIVLPPKLCTGIRDTSQAGDIETNGEYNENRCEPIRKSITENQLQQPQPGLSINADREDEQSAIKRKAFIKRFFRGSTSSESEMETEALAANKVDNAVTHPEIEVCRQNMPETSNGSFNDATVMSHSSHWSLPEEPGIIRNSISSDEFEINMPSQNECTLYHQHSDSSSSSVFDNDENSWPSQNKDPVGAVIPTTGPEETIAIQNFATTTITKCQVSTSITMQQTRLVGSHAMPAVATNAVASPTVAVEDLVLDEQRHELALTTTKNALDNYCKGIVPAFNPRLFGRESINLKHVFQQNLNEDFEHTLKRAKNTCVDIFLEKVGDLGSRIFDEIEKQQQEQQEIESSVEKIVRQLSWQFQAYQQNSQRLMCFKQNTEALLQALTEINISEEIDKKFDNMLAQLAESSRHVSSEQWRNFVQQSTDHMLRNLSNLSQL